MNGNITMTRGVIEITKTNSMNFSNERPEHIAKIPENHYNLVDLSQAVSAPDVLPTDNVFTVHNDRVVESTAKQAAKSDEVIGKHLKSMLNEELVVASEGGSYYQYTPETELAPSSVEQLNPQSLAAEQVVDSVASESPWWMSAGKITPMLAGAGALGGAGLALGGGSGGDKGAEQDTVSPDSSIVLEANARPDDISINKPVLSIDDITEDNIINTSESEAVITVTGTAKNVTEGTGVTLTVGMAEYTATVSNNKFSVDIDGKSLVNHQAITAELTDSFNQTVNIKHEYGVDLTGPAPVITIDDVTDDNVLNIAESQSDVTVSGHVEGVLAGEEITVSCSCPSCSGVSWKDLVTEVNADGKFNVIFDGSDVAKGAVIKVSVPDEGNTVEANKNYTTDLEAPEVALQIDDISVDNIINANDVNGEVTVSGTLAGLEADSTAIVKVTVGAQTFDATVDSATKTFSVDIDGAILKSSTTLKAAATVTDVAGNKSQLEATASYDIDVKVDATITFDSIAGDNVLSVSEATGEVTLSGKVTGEYHSGDNLVLTVGSHKLVTTVVDDDGMFSVTVDGDALAKNSDHVVKAVLETTDLAGNVAVVTGASEQYSVEKAGVQATDTDASLSLNGITNDNLINVTEAKGMVEISGTAKAVAVGQVVEILVGSKTYEATVDADSTFKINVAGSELAEVDNYNISAQLKDDVSTKVVHTYAVDDYVAAGIQLNNISESAHSALVNPNYVRISGELDFSELDFSVAANAHRLHAINLNIGNKTYHAAINEENQSFYADVKVEDLINANGTSLDYSIDTADKFMKLSVNSKIIFKGDPNEKLVLLVDAPTLDATNTGLELDNTNFLKLNSDNTYSIHSDALNSQLMTKLTGSVTGNAQAGDTVDISVGDKSFSAKVDTKNQFELSVKTSELAKLSGDDVTATLKTTDLAGNTVEVSDKIGVISSEVADSTMVNHVGMLESYADLPYFLQVLDEETFINTELPSNYAAFHPGWLQDHAHGNEAGTHKITYHFGTREEGEGYRNSEGKSVGGIIDFTNKNKAAVRAVLDNFEKYIDVDFVEVGSAEESDLDYYMGTLNENFNPKSGYTAGYAVAGGDVLLSRKVYGDEEDSYYGSLDSNKGMNTIAHETMHTFGMSHPFAEGRTNPAGMSKTALDTDVESLGLSLMSYSENDFLGTTDIRIYDLAQIHYRFGVNTDARSGNDTYTFKTFNSSKVDGDVYIWDGSGIDTFDASNEANGVYVNLTPGSSIYSYKAGYSDTDFAVQGILKASAHDLFSNEIGSNDPVYFGRENAKGTYSYYKTGETTVYDFTEGHSFIGYGTQIENLTGSSYDDKLIGNKADNAIYAGNGDDTVDGGEGNDYLDGGNGADTMNGGLGNDTFIVDDKGDLVAEYNNEGLDGVFSSLTNYTLGANVENLALIGDAVVGNGNSLANVLAGNNTDNMLSGGLGDDTLIGNGGNDTLTGGLGADTFVFHDLLDGSVDTIIDFSKTQGDTIELDSDIFTSLTAGSTDNVSDYIEYNSVSGNLSYDSDASGSVDAIHFATLNTGLNIDESCFTVI